MGPMTIILNKAFFWMDTRGCTMQHSLLEEEEKDYFSS